jgi:hypothetical protein
MHEAPHSLEGYEPDHAQQEQRVRQGGQNSGAMVAVGAAGVGGPSRLPGREPGQSQSQRVGGDVTGVGEQRKRMRPEPPQELYGDNCQCERQREPQGPVGGGMW